MERLNGALDWDIFRPDLERIDQKVRKSAAGCKPTCRVLIFKLLILQRLYGLSDERLEYQVRDCLSFMRFLGLGLDGKIPDARTVWAFREALKRHQLAEVLFERLNQTLAGMGIRMKSGQIIDASWSEAREQRLAEGGHRSQIHERAYRDAPLSAEQRARNKAKSRVRARVEHVFGQMENGMGGMFLRSVGLARAKVGVALMNLAYNLRRVEWLIRSKVFPFTRVTAPVRGAA